MSENIIKELEIENERLKLRITELIKQCDEIYELLKRHRKGYWWCETCMSGKLPTQININDICKNCANPVQWVEDLEKR